MTTKYLIARALQFFAPGVPQVYYGGLLAGSNDLNLLRRTGVGRDINRHYYTPAELNDQMQRPVVRSLFELIRFRNTHPAFAGDFHLLPSEDDSHPDGMAAWRRMGTVERRSENNVGGDCAFNSGRRTSIRRSPRPR